MTEHTVILKTLRQQPFSISHIIYYIYVYIYIYTYVYIYIYVYIYMVNMGI